MQTPDSTEPTRRVEITGPGVDAPLPTVTAADPAARAEAIPAELERLNRNYRELVRARAIFCPVAYRFERELGRGRQGIVFLAVRHGARGCVIHQAIKLFDPSIYRSPNTYWTDMGRIAAQISRLQAIQSPYLVSRGAYEEYRGIGYVQMELIDGLDLQTLMGTRHLERARGRSSREEWDRFSDVLFRIHRDRFSIQPGIAVYIMRRLLRGLELIHAFGFAHCDVKPANCMLDRFGYLKVIDHGRAVQLGEKVSLLLGTPYYMAPEVHRREPMVPGSDLYSVGILGLEMMLGKRLLRAESEEQLLRYKERLPERLPDLLPQHVRTNDAFVNMLRRLIAVDPAERYPSARDAESGPEGLVNVHLQLKETRQDAEYGRELENYLSKLIDPATNRVEM